MGNSLPEAAWDCKTAQAVKLLKYLDLVHTELLDTAARSGLRADNADLCELLCSHFLGEKKRGLCWTEVTFFTPFV